LSAAVGAAADAAAVADAACGGAGAAAADVLTAAEPTLHFGPDATGTLAYWLSREFIEDTLKPQLAAVARGAAGVPAVAAAAVDANGDLKCPHGAVRGERRLVKRVWAETWRRVLAFDPRYARSTALPAAEPAVGGGCAQCAASTVAEAKAGAELFSQRKAEAAGESRACVRVCVCAFSLPCVVSLACAPRWCLVLFLSSARARSRRLVFSRAGR